MRFDRPPDHTTETLNGTGWILVALAFLSRLLFLNADPAFPDWIGYITDEGRWNETARNLALFNSFEMTPLARMHLLMSPGLQTASYASFLVFGVDFWSARLFSALCGGLLVLLVFVALRRRVDGFALAIGLSILAFEPGLLALSRVALPEIPAVFMSLTAFLLLVMGAKTSANAFMAGLLAAGAAACKATSVTAALTFAVLLLLSAHEGALRRRAGRAFWFSAGFGAPLLVGLSAAIGMDIIELSGVAEAVTKILGFVAPLNPRQIAFQFLTAEDLEIRNLGLLTAWFCSWLWLYRASQAPSMATELYTASGIWAAGWLLLWSTNQYLPGRYVVHFVVPAALHVVAGLSLMRADTFSRMADDLRRRRGPMRLLLLAWLVLPAAILTAPVVAYLAEAGHPLAAPRATVKIAFIIASGAVLLAILLRRANLHRSVVAVFLLLPVVVALSWITGRNLHLYLSFWTFESGSQLVTWLAIAAAGAVGCTLLFQLRRAGIPLSMIQPFVIAMVAAALVVPIAPSIVQPTYTIRNASRLIEQDLAGSPEIRTVSAGTLFLGNGLRYRELSKHDPAPASLVAFESSVAWCRFIGSGRFTSMARAGSIGLTVHPLYLAREEKDEPIVIGIYRLVTSAAGKTGR